MSTRAHLPGRGVRAGVWSSPNRTLGGGGGGYFDRHILLWGHPQIEQNEPKILGRGGKWPPSPNTTGDEPPPQFIYYFRPFGAKTGSLCVGTVDSPVSSTLKSLPGSMPWAKTWRKLSKKRLISDLLKPITLVRLVASGIRLVLYSWHHWVPLLLNINCFN